jgi:predicted MFS family arabinose efflux permease
MRLMGNPGARNILSACLLRSCGDFCLFTFLPVYIGRVFPVHRLSFAIIYPVIVIGAGFASNVLSGLVSDVLESRSFFTKSLICTVETTLSIPLIAVCCISTRSFNLAIISYALSVLISGGWSCNSLTMIQNLASDISSHRVG